MHKRPVVMFIQKPFEQVEVRVKKDYLHILLSSTRMVSLYRRDHVHAKALIHSRGVGRKDHVAVFSLVVLSTAEIMFIL